MLRRSGLEQLLGCMRMFLFVRASGASGKFIDCERRELRLRAVQVKATATPSGRDGKPVGLQVLCNGQIQ